MASLSSHLGHLGMKKTDGFLHRPGHLERAWFKVPRFHYQRSPMLLSGPVIPQGESSARVFCTISCRRAANWSVPAHHRALPVAASLRSSAEKPPKFATRSCSPTPTPSVWCATSNPDNGLENAARTYWCRRTPLLCQRHPLPLLPIILRLASVHQRFPVGIHPLSAESMPPTRSLAPPAVPDCRPPSEFDHATSPRRAFSGWRTP